MRNVDWSELEKDMVVLSEKYGVSLVCLPQRAWTEKMLRDSYVAVTVEQESGVVKKNRFCTADG